MSLPPPITHTAPERHAQEVLNGWLKSYFDGQSHALPGGNEEFPDAERLFNQATLPDPAEGKIQIHTVFTSWKPKENWFANGPLQTWSATLASPYGIAPASGAQALGPGVIYGATTEGNVEESVHGQSVRRIPGTDIRWVVQSGALREQVLNGTTWTDVRTFAGEAMIRWRRASTTPTADYLEETSADGVTWNIQRSIAPIDGVWDGTKRVVTVDAIFSFFVRMAYRGADDAEFRVRKASTLLERLITTPQTRADLTQRGFRRISVASRAPIASTGFAVRLVVTEGHLRYYAPVEGK